MFIPEPPVVTEDSPNELDTEGSLIFDALSHDMTSFDDVQSGMWPAPDNLGPNFSADTEFDVFDDALQNHSEVRRQVVPTFLFVNPGNTSPAAATNPSYDIHRQNPSQLALGPPSHIWNPILAGSQTSTTTDDFLFEFQRVDDQNWIQTSQTITDLALAITVEEKSSIPNPLRATGRNFGLPSGPMDEMPAALENADSSNMCPVPGFILEPRAEDIEFTPHKKKR